MMIDDGQYLGKPLGSLITLMVEPAMTTPAVTRHDAGSDATGPGSKRRSRLMKPMKPQIKSSPLGCSSLEMDRYGMILGHVLTCLITIDLALWICEAYCH